MTLYPRSLAFTSQLVGTTSPAQNVTLTNTGTGTLTISSIAASGDFAQTNTCGGTVNFQASCTISVTFTPTAIGTRTGTITITDNTSSSPQIISLTGTGIGPAVTLSPASPTFADQLVGAASLPKNLTLANSGTATLAIWSIAPSGDFSETNTCGASVAAGASCTISVTFKPSVKGVRIGAIAITDNARPSTQAVTLTGAGTVVSFSPASLTFTTQLIGTTSGTKSVTLTNTGATPLSVSGVSITGTNSGDFTPTNTCVPSVPAGKSCTLSVKFTPTAGGARLAALTIADNGGGSPQHVKLAGTGTVVSLSPASLNFGSVKVGKVSPTKISVLTNLGTTTLSISGITVTGADPGDFLESNTCGSSVAGGGTCSIILNFVPTKTGARTASVSITDNGGGSPQKVTLAGTGT